PKLPKMNASPTWTSNSVTRSLAVVVPLPSESATSSAIAADLSRFISASSPRQKLTLASQSASTAPEELQRGTKKFQNPPKNCKARRDEIRFADPDTENEAWTGMPGEISCC